MTQFLALLASYYVCDAAAATAHLDRKMIARCIQTYQSVKVHFLTAAERKALADDPLGFGGEHGSTAYLRFKAWEEVNAGLVERMKSRISTEIVDDTDA